MKKAAAVIVLWIGSVAAAGEAVSAVNGKVGYAGGSMDGDWGNNVFASAGVPLARNFGFQLDGLYTNVSDRDFVGSAGHLFWRDSDRGLLGIAGGGIHQDDISSLRLGVEGEYYLKHVTLALGAGVASLEYDNGPFPFIDDDVTDFFASAAVRYYPLENLMLSASYLHAFDNELVLGMVECQTPIHGLSPFAQVAEGEHDYDHALFGIQFYIGKPKSLKLRHREDDPPSIMPEILYGVGLYGAEFHKEAVGYARTHGTPEGGSSDYGLFLQSFSGSGSYGYSDGMSEWAVRESPPSL